MSAGRLEVTDVLRTHGDDFLARWERVLSRPQRKAFDDIRACRTAFSFSISSSLSDLKNADGFLSLRFSSS